MLDGCLRLLAYRPAAPCFDLVRPQQCLLRLFEQLFAHHCQFRADPAGLVLGPEADENSAAIASLWKSPRDLFWIALLFNLSLPLSCHHCGMWLWITLFSSPPSFLPL
jgi:hypothetical protein